MLKVNEKGEYKKFYGWMVCLPDTTCIANGNGCFSDRDSCETQIGGVCDTDNGWFLNSDRNDCNIFACTTDGSLMNTNSKAGTLAPLNNDAHFTYDKPSNQCLRKAPFENPSDDKYCTWGWGDLVCNRDNNYPTDPNGWTGYTCGLGKGCDGSLSDETPQIYGTKGGPIYSYIARESSSDTDEPKCWNRIR